MQLTKPKPTRVAITARDPDGKSPSKSVTVYDTTPAELISLLKRVAKTPAGKTASGQ